MNLLSTVTNFSLLIFGIVITITIHIMDSIRLHFHEQINFRIHRKPSAITAFAYSGMFFKNFIFGTTISLVIIAIKYFMDNPFQINDETNAFIFDYGSFLFMILLLISSFISYIVFIVEQKNNYDFYTGLIDNVQFHMPLPKCKLQNAILRLIFKKSHFFCKIPSSSFALISGVLMMLIFSKPNVDFVFGAYGLLITILIFTITLALISIRNVNSSLEKNAQSVIYQSTSNTPIIGMVVDIDSDFVYLIHNKNLHIINKSSILEITPVKKES